MFSMSAIFHKQYITYCSADNYNDVQSVPRNTNYLGAECLHEACLTSIADARVVKGTFVLQKFYLSFSLIPHQVFLLVHSVAESSLHRSILNENRVLNINSLH